MAPNLTQLYFANSGLRNPIHLCKNALRQATIAYFYYILARYFGLSMLLSISMSIAISCVLIVFNLRSCFQMIWINTRRIIAEVPYNQAVWYLALMEFITKSMRTHSLATMPAFEIEDSITPHELSASPIPASRSGVFVYSFKKEACNIEKCSGWSAHNINQINRGNHYAMG